jgi:hypothetical protein
MEQTVLVEHLDLVVFLLAAEAQAVALLEVEHLVETLQQGLQVLQVEQEFIL